MTKTALVTGASRGIGNAIAHRLAAAGYRLTVSARTEPGLLTAAEELRAQHGVDVHPVVANLAEPEAVQRLAAEHSARYERLDLLVPCGGVGTAGPIAEVPLKHYDLTLNVNLRSVFLLVQATLPLLRKTSAASPENGAKIVALSSITGVAAEPGMSAYGASKAALISLCETITLDEHARGVTATAISPGYVDTDMASYAHDQVDSASMIRTGDIAEMVLAVSRLSANATVPNIVITRPGTAIWRP
ncbi:SDR family NAD(P)-dependent oxidoreductase [Saccharopolyspora sp. ASAGF58]|uniref:SDR family NAD(P)-dependent oxidoreductase n=1 Tax=Saccharopolyspora sp. ASAGF58 TaxID=2719023 RepID=UPI00143FE91E|nr:SDR family oxidoreductase [Saccharopolyspora sp. ASAGF58]QIZ38003.1 SDR family oxidoreductase [Saccharopolyspora sp. ASAGF58]